MEKSCYRQLDPNHSQASRRRYAGVCVQPRTRHEQRDVLRAARQIWGRGCVTDGSTIPYVTPC